MGHVLTVPAPGGAGDLTRVVRPTAPGAYQRMQKGSRCFSPGPLSSAENWVLGLPVNTLNYSINTIETAAWFHPAGGLLRNDCRNSLVHKYSL